MASPHSHCQPTQNTVHCPFIFNSNILFSLFRSLTSNLPNSNILPNKWTTNWIAIYKTYSKFGAKVTASSGKRHYVTNDTASPPLNGGGHKGRNEHEHQHRKGKSSKCRQMRKSWSWKAGAGWTILSMLDWWLIAAGGWLTWRGLFLKWTPIGVGLVAAVHWHLRNQECDRKGLPRTASKWMVSVIDLHRMRPMCVCVAVIILTIICCLSEYSDGHVLLITAAFDEPNVGLAG